MTENEPVPIPVRLTNPEALAGAAPRPQPRRRITSRYRTFVLNAANNWILPVGGEDLSRHGGWVIAYGNSIVLCESQAQAQDPFNTTPLGAAAAASVTGTGLQASPPAGTAVASAAAPAGTYAVNWSTVLTGTLAAGDEQNMGLYVGATLQATCVNGINAGTIEAQPPVQVVVPTGGATIAVKAINNASASTTYQASFSATPAVSGAFAATPANPAGTLLYVPTGAGQVQASVRWRLESNDVVWASAAYLTGASVALLAVTWNNRAEGW